METNHKAAKFKSEIERAKKILIKTLGFEIKDLDIQLALAAHFNIQYHAQLVDKELNAEQIIEILKEHDFSSNNSAVYQAWISRIAAEQGNE